MHREGTSCCRLPISRKMLHRANTKPKGLRIFIGVVWPIALLCAVATLLVSPVASSENETFPSGLSHGFGAAFSGNHEHDDGGPETNAQNQQLAPGQLIIEVDPALVTHTASWDEEPEEEDREEILIRIARSLQTVTELRNGTILDGSGSGFAFGNHLITALHVLQGPKYDSVINHYAMVNGRPVQAKTIYPDVDIAVIELPHTTGNDSTALTFAGLQDVYPDQAINWLYPGEGESIKKQASVIGFATLAADADNSAGQTGCDDNLVVLTDLPFEQGTSGGPVVDAQSGKILGIIQGTLNETTLASGISNPGFFKPIACVAALIDLAAGNTGS